jgi:hypothetical protein
MVSSTASASHLFPGFLFHEAFAETGSQKSPARGVTDAPITNARAKPHDGRRVMSVSILAIFENIPERMRQGSHDQTWADRRFPDVRVN